MLYQRLAGNSTVVKRGALRRVEVFQNQNFIELTELGFYWRVWYIRMEFLSFENSLGINLGFVNAEEHP